MTFFIGVDLHKTQFTVHVRTEEESESLDQIRQYPTTTDGYAEFLTRISRYKATGSNVKIGVESTGNTRFFKNQVEKAGAEVTVINTLKFKVINESAKKTDKHDASTISEFLSKDMLPESYLCGKETENIRRLLKSRERLVRSTVGQKNEIHALLVSLGFSDELRSLQSKKGRQKILDTLESNNDYVLEAQSVKLMFEIIERIEESVKIIEKQLVELTKDDEMVNRLMTIRGCGKITAWTIRAYTEESDKIITIRATGGAVAFNIDCLDAQYWSPRRGLFFNLFIEELPPALATNRRLKIRAERDHRWQGGEQYFETYQVGNYVWFPEDEENEFIKVLKGAEKIFLTADYIINYKGIDFAQTFYGNWADWDEQNNCEIPDSNWFTDYDALDQSVAKLARVEIESIDNEGDPNFVSAPVASHVKEQAKEWNAPYVIAPDPWYEKCKITVYDASGKKTDVNETAGQVKVRGNYTTTYDKKSLRIKFDKKQDMLGLNVNEKGKANKYKNWVLLSSYKDASLLRDGVAFKMYKTMFPEYYSSNGELVEVFVNGIYWGVYLLAEQPETKDGRINITE
ncbi:MAG: CotH kinase family protein, partial [Spirochaetaceae bacterium]|nr:CotH kinase family protein [Spirochaetaceae bacterium]